MANRSEAYDFSYFEDISSVSAVEDNFAYQPAEAPEVEAEPREKVVELPQREPERKPKHRRNPFKMVLASVGFLLVFGAGLAAVYSDAQLTELGNKIADTQKQLEEAQSLEVQLTMQAAQQMSDAEVEAYAIEKLGMGKLSGSQVVYLHVAQQDRGTVVQETGEPSWLDKVLSEVKSWFS